MVVLDERGATGGQYAKPLADSHADAAPDRAVPPRRCELRAARAGGRRRIVTEATVWGGFAPDEIAALVARPRGHLPAAPAGAGARRA